MSFRKPPMIGGDLCRSLRPITLASMMLMNSPVFAAIEGVETLSDAAHMTQSTVAAPLSSNQSISLSQALAKVLESNQQLQQYPMYLRQYDLKRLIAARKPAWTVNASLENVLGSGDYSGVDNAEITVLLQTLFERGDKAAKRTQVVDAKLAAEQQSYDVLKLELLADTRRNYYQLLRLQSIKRWAEDNLQQQRSAMKTVQRLVDAGAINQADKQKMSLQVQNSEAQLSRVEGELQAQSLRLQSMWLAPGDSVVSPGGWLAQGNLAATSVPSSERVINALLEAPSYLLANAQSRVAQAAWHLSQSQKLSDISFGLGVRRFQGSRDQALLFEFSMPLQQAERAALDSELSQSNLRIKQAEQSLLQWQLQQRLLLLRKSLLNNQEQINRASNRLLPQSQRYQLAAKRAYETGQYSLLQWLDAQTQVTEIKRHIIELKSDFWMKWIELERLSGRSFAKETGLKQ